MAKYLLTNAKVMVNNVDLSNHAFSLDTPEEAEQVDVSGFNPNNTKEFLKGQVDQTITVEFRQDFAGSSVHQTLQPLFSSGTTFTILVQPDATAGTSAANPTFSGTAQMFNYNGLTGTLNDPGQISAEFKPASNTGFAWGTA